MGPVDVRGAEVDQRLERRLGGRPALRTNLRVGEQPEGGFADVAARGL
jgi:hypothetical protein